MARGNLAEALRRVERNADAAGIDGMSTKELLYSLGAQTVVPTPLVSRGLRTLQPIARPAAFTTWDEAELTKTSMISARGRADARALGVAQRMAELEKPATPQAHRVAAHPEPSRDLGVALTASASKHDPRAQ